MELTEQQKAFIEAMCNIPDSINLEAVAGSGKTTTMVQGVARYADKYPLATILCCAFNKRIAEELANRMPPTAESKTTHSIGYGAWAKTIYPNKMKAPNGFKTSKIIEHLDQYDYTEDRDFLASVRKMVSQAKASGLVPKSLENAADVILVHDELDNWMEMLDYFNIEVDAGREHEAINVARYALKESYNWGLKGIIDFDDMLYLPVCYGGKFRRYDLILIDEAQDIASIQLELLSKCSKPTTRLIAVGDPNQAIYGFRGAGINSMSDIQDVWGSKSMRLNYSFRCPKSVVDVAKQWVPDIESCPDAPLGEVHYLEEWNADNVLSKDAIICRNTKPLIDIAFRLIAANKNAMVLGSDIGKNLIGLINRQQAADIKDLVDKLCAWRDKQTKYYDSIGAPEKADAVEDRIASILIVIENLDPEDDIPELRDKIESIFKDRQKGIVLSTIHKAKGLEWDRVFFLDRQLLPSKHATRDWELSQENNLCYVAVTRAKQALFYVTSKGYKNSEEYDDEQEAML